MTPTPPIPDFSLFGETGAFPDVVHCERIYARAPRHDWVISPHRHGHMAQVFCLEDGAAQVQIDGMAQEFLPGQFLFIPPGVVHGFVFARGTEGLVLSFPMPVLAGIGPSNPDLTHRLGHTFGGMLDADLSGLSASLADHFSRTGTFRAQMLVALSHAILTGIAETDSGGAPPDHSGTHRHIQRLNMLIAAHLGDGWRPRAYAAAMGITPGHLNRICHDAVGHSASQHIDLAVMTEACRLLAFTQMSVSEVGYRLNYQDPPYFSRRFRAVIGETPTAYRARFLTDG